MHMKASSASGIEISFFATLCQPQKRFWDSNRNVSTIFCARLILKLYANQRTFPNVCLRDTGFKKMLNTYFLKPLLSDFEKKSTMRISKKWSKSI